MIAELNMQLNARLKIFTTSTFITLEESQSLLCVLLLFSAVRVFANPCKVVCRAVQGTKVVCVCVQESNVGNLCSRVTGDGKDEMLSLHVHPQFLIACALVAWMGMCLRG